MLARLPKSKKPAKNATDAVAVAADALPPSVYNGKKIPVHGNVARARGIPLNRNPFCPKNNAAKHKTWADSWKKHAEAERLRKLRVSLNNATRSKACIAANIENGFHYYVGIHKGSELAMYYREGYMRVALVTTQDGKSVLLNAEEARSTIMHNLSTLQTNSYSYESVSLGAISPDKRNVLPDIRTIEVVKPTKTPKKGSRAKKDVATRSEAYEVPAGTNVCSFVSYDPASTRDVHDASKMLEFIRAKGLISRIRDNLDRVLVSNVPKHSFAIYTKHEQTVPTVNDGLALRHGSFLFTTENVSTEAEFEATIKMPSMKEIIKEYAKHAVSEYEKKLADAKENYTRKLEELQHYALEINESTNLISMVKTNAEQVYEAALKRIEALPGVVSVSYGTELLIKTEKFWYNGAKDGNSRLYYEKGHLLRRYCGEFEIKYNIVSGRLAFRNMTPNKSKLAMTVHYLGDGKACMGTYDRIMLDAVKTGRYDVLVNLVLDFIQEPHLTDGAARRQYLLFSTEEPKEVKEPSEWVVIFNGHEGRVKSNAYVSESYHATDPALRPANTVNEDMDDGEEETNF